MLPVLSIFLKIIFAVTAQTEYNSSVQVFVPNVCNEFETFTTCKSVTVFCRAHCPLALEPKLDCPEVCLEGCDCAPGYLFDLYSTKCVDKKYCLTLGDQHAIYSNCSAEIQPTCQNQNRQSSNSTCVPGYVCEEGYVRNATGWCVLPNNC